MISVKRQGYDEIPQRPIDRLKPLRENSSTRWKTFNNFPDSAQVSAVDLYNDGFFYIGDGTNDRVQCAYCGGILKNFKKDDNVHSEHKRIFSRCSYVNSVSKTSDTQPDSNFLFGLQSESSNNDKVHTLKPVRHPRYSTKSSRLETYKNWPSDMKQRPDGLSEVGLFYAGESDKTICYHCGGLLEEWEPDDVPQTEHDNWFPDCYLAQTRTK